MIAFRLVLWAVLAALLCMALPGLANLHDTGNAADYLIITRGDLIQQNAWIGELAAWRAQHGRTTMVVATDSIWAEFGSGIPSDSILKDFLFYAYDHWSAPRLRDVFIIGWQDVVPSHIQRDSISSMDSSGHFYWAHYDHLSDFCYSTHPDSTNHRPVLSLGRLPWSPADTFGLPDYYAKVHGYETIGGEAWQHRVQVIADFMDSQFNFWQDFAQPIASEILPGYEIERDYMDRPVGDPWHGDREEMLAHMNAGNYMTFYVGHGGSGWWSGHLLLTAQGADSLVNGSRLPIISAYGCDAGMNDDWVVGGLASAFLCNPNGGAIGVLGTTSTSWLFRGTELRRVVARLATSDSVQTLGDLWRMTVDEYVSQNATEPWIGGSPFVLTVRSSILFGDPGVVLPARPAAVEEKAAALPGNAHLVGNYPNPFNGWTELRFELSQPQMVRLRVMNILGQEVARLADGYRPAGAHVALWNAAECGSGVYFALFEAGNVRQVRKMMLLK
jgi:hypothetical protein